MRQHLGLSCVPARLEPSCTTDKWGHLPPATHRNSYVSGVSLTGGLEAGGAGLADRILVAGERVHGPFWSRYLAQDPLTYVIPR